MTKAVEHMWRFWEVRDELDRSYSDVVSALTITPRSIPATPKDSIDSPATCNARQ